MGHVFEKDLTAREAWEVLHPAIIAGGLEQECRSLLEFLMVLVAAMATDLSCDVAPHLFNLRVHCEWIGGSIGGLGGRDCETSQPQ